METVQAARATFEGELAAGETVTVHVGPSGVPALLGRSSDGRLVSIPCEMVGGDWICVVLEPLTILGLGFVE